MGKTANIIIELLKPILFVLGITLMNVALYTVSFTYGLLASGISLVGIALLIDYESQN